MAFDDHKGANSLATTISERIKKQIPTDLALDFGTIGKDFSLRTNTFPESIPKSDYSVCRTLAGLSISGSGGSHGGHTSGSGSHSHEFTAPVLRSGDRVLVAWVQKEAVVIDVIVAAKNI